MTARETSHYGNEDWVRSPRSNEENGNGNSSDSDDDEYEDSSDKDPDVSDSDWNESEDYSDNDSTAGELLKNTRRTFLYHAVQVTEMHAIAAMENG